MEDKNSGEKQDASDGKKSEEAYGHVSRVIAAGNVVTASWLEKEEKKRLRCLKNADHNARQAQQDKSSESFVAGDPTGRRCQASIV